MNGAADDATDRRAAIEAGLAAVRRRIEVACAEVGRDAAEITLIVVTKFFPPIDVRLLADLGVRDVGENRHQEAVEKSAECADLGLRWHFIGGLQSNKAAAVARYADVVHSVDRAKLVGGLDRGASETARQVECLLQVSLDPPGASGRSGCDPGELLSLAERVLETESLVLRGVMGVAPLGGDPDAAFADLAEHAERVRAIAPQAQWISAGMSGDLEAAVRHGATHLRVGSAVLGPRPAVK